MSKVKSKEKKEKNCEKKVMEEDIEDVLLKLTPKEVKIIFKDTNREPLIIKKPKEAYWWENRFKYIKDRKEHHIHQDLIAEVEIIHKNKNGRRDIKCQT